MGDERKYDEKRQQGRATAKAAAYLHARPSFSSPVMNISCFASLIACTIAAYVLRPSTSHLALQSRLGGAKELIGFHWTASLFWIRSRIASTQSSASFLLGASISTRPWSVNIVTERASCAP